MSLLTRKRTILAKLETTYGVDPTPTGSADAMLVRNLNVTPIEAQQVSRDLIRPYLGNSDTLLAQVSVKAEFEVELAGSSAPGTAPHYAPLLKACGFAETIAASTSVTYAPISASFPSVTLYYNVDGVLHKMTGARGTFDVTMNVQQIPVIKFTFTGIYNAPSDTTAPTVDFSAFQIPKVVNTQNTTSFSLFSYSGLLSSMSLSLANDIQYRTLVNYEAVNLIDRKPTGTFVMEAPTITSKDFFSIAKAGTTGAMSITHGTVAGNIVTLSAPRVSLANPNYQDSQGVQMLSIPFVIAPNTGNDEISIQFT